MINLLVSGDHRHSEQLVGVNLCSVRVEIGGAGIAFDSIDVSCRKLQFASIQASTRFRVAIFRKANSSWYLTRPLVTRKMSTKV